MSHFEEAKSIWTQFVPKSGQAETVQGELLRAVEKLRDEATRNGNGNWDHGFKILLTYLVDHLLNAEIFAPPQIAATKSILDRLHDYDHPVLEDTVYDELGDRVVEYYRHTGSLPHQKNPDLRR